MLRLAYLYRNLTRNPMRALLTCAAVALPITIYVLSMSVVDGVNRFLDNSARQLRLAVTHRASIINPLPAGYRAKIESLDPTRTRLLSVCGIDWIGGKIEGDPRPLSALGADHDTFIQTFPEYRLTPGEIAEWNRDRRAIIVGPAAARQFGWSVGDRITINPSLPPYQPMEFRVISTAPRAEDPLTLWFHRQYLVEARRQAGWEEERVGFYFIKCASQADLEHFRAAIDSLFANTPDETRTQDEKAFMNEFITQQFNLPRNLTILAAVTVFVAVMAAANTMSMNFRDRLNELATLKAMGFRGTLISAIIQAESLFLCTVGGLLGALGPYLAFNHTPLRDFTVPLIQQLDVRAATCGKAMLIAAGISVLAALWPAWLAARMNVVTALRNLE